MTISRSDVTAHDADQRSVLDRQVRPVSAAAVLMVAIACGLAIAAAIGMMVEALA